MTVGPRSVARMTWPDVAEASGIVVIPLGSCEQHGPHLPLDTDTRIAAAVSIELVARDPRLILGPTLAIGASGEHAGFPGTLSVGCDALTTLLIEVCRSADAFTGVLVVNAHGGNADPLASAGAVCLAEGRRFAAVSCHVPGGDPHAGWAETSMLLHLDPDAVRMDCAVAGDTRPWSEIRAVVLEQGVGAVSPSGVLGDPTGATSTDGERLFDGLVVHVAAEVAGIVSGWSR